MLTLRPNCEYCDRDLPPDAPDARICSYECTYCATCVETVLHDVCPTCGGNFAPRPIRPRTAFRATHGLGLAHHPGSRDRIHTKFTDDDIAAHVARIRQIAPEDR